MRTIRKILRLRFNANLSYHKIARSCSVSSSTVSDVLKRTEETGLSWAVLERLDDSDLEKRLYPERFRGGKSGREPDWSYIHKELKKKNVTLQLLWEEYKADTPGDTNIVFSVNSIRNGVKLLMLLCASLIKLGKNYS